jgi:hypothetical protein
MSQETSANSVIKTFKAAGVITPGHAVELTAAGTVAEVAAAGNKAVGIYVGTEACVANDHVPICVQGVCRAWADAGVAITVNPPCYLADNASGHMHIEATTTVRALGIALEPLASGTGYIEMLVSPFVIAA